jgi:hypothetical protein
MDVDRFAYLLFGSGEDTEVAPDCPDALPGFVCVAQ